MGETNRKEAARLNDRDARRGVGERRQENNANGRLAFTARTYNMRERERVRNVVGEKSVREEGEGAPWNN